MAKPTKQTELQGSGELISRIVCQAAVILVLSFTLGLAFNASNPIGIVWSGTSQKKNPPLPPSFSAGTNQPRSAQSLVASSPNGSAPPAVQTGPTPASRPDVTSVATIRPNDPSAQVIWSKPPTATTNPAPAMTNATNAVAQAAPPTRYAGATTWAQTKPLVEAGKAVLIDARPKPVYDAGHIPGAVSLPEGSPVEEFTALQKKYPADAHLVVYCSSTSCSVSKRVADKITQEYGFANVSFMTGGYQEWQQAELAQKQTTTNDPAIKP